MAIFRDAQGNLIDTTGSTSPVSAAGNPAPSAESVPPTNSNAVAVSDFKYTDPTTFAVITSRG